MRPTDPREHNAFAIKRHGKSGNYKRISAAAFCSHLRLRFDRTMLFQNPDLDNNGVMMLELAGAVKVGRGAREGGKDPMTPSLTLAFRFDTMVLSHENNGLGR